MIDVLQDHLFCFGVLDLVLLDDVVLVDRFHSEELLRDLLLHQQNCAECSLPEDDLRHKIVDGDLFLEIIPGVERLCGLPDHFLLLLLALEILLEGKVVMKDEISFDFLDALLLLLLLGGGVVD